MNIQLLRKLGNINQIAGIRELQFTEGDARGLRMLEVYNAAGLRFSVMVDRGMDLYDFSFRGQNIAFHSKNGLNGRSESSEDAFFHQWPGGMLNTCGLLNVGAACTDAGVHPIHGRIGFTPARHISVQEGWQGDDYILSVRGEVWETRLYGQLLSLTRIITTGLYDKTVSITDTITNHGGEPQDIMLLYHINFGYPLLDEQSFFISSPAKTKPCNDFSHEWAHMCAPGAETAQQMFLHTPKGERAHAAIIHPDLRLGGAISFDTAHMPYLFEWKNMSAHDYVVALEPCNCEIMGRANARESGALQALPAYRSISQRLSIGALDGQSEIDDFIKMCKA